LKAPILGAWIPAVLRAVWRTVSQWQMDSKVGRNCRLGPQQGAGIAGNWSAATGSIVSRSRHWSGSGARNSWFRGENGC